MKTLLITASKLLVFSLFLFLLSSCDKQDEDIALGVSGEEESAYSDSPSVATEEKSSGSGDSNNNPNAKPGVITAGEWNDLDHWDYWKKLLSTTDSTSLGTFVEQWQFFPTQRVTVQVLNPSDKPLANIEVSLSYKEEKLWTSRTDNFGRAHLWLNLNGKQTNYSLQDCKVVFGSQAISPVRAYQAEQDVMRVTLQERVGVDQQIDIAYIVDATGSMGDEINFLKTELNDVIQRVVHDNPDLLVRTASVFYRDVEDDYLTKESPFSPNASQTINFMRNQQADGGGDYPEAVHSGLDKTINTLKWNTRARTKIAFLILDAPPHNNRAVIKNIQQSILNASKKGIKIIPITASGINKETESIMRAFSIATNGTYVFITNHSGVGGDHIEATVGDYEVELLNDLMVRLVNKYAQ